MSKIQKHVEIVHSTIQSLTSMSQESANAILTVLKRKYKTVGISIVNTSADLEALAQERPDLVFVGMKYVPTGLRSKLWISEFLESQGIPHTGSTYRAIAYELSKPLAKQRVSEEGIPTARFFTVKNGETLSDEDITLNFPLFVKPADLGGGTGVNEASYARNMSELHSKVASIAQEHNTDVLIEEYLPGREFSVALFSDPYSSKLVAMPLELVAPTNGQGSPALSQDIKSANEEIVLAVTDPVLREQINSIATRAFRALGARDYGRIDIRLDQSGVPHFLEANLIPSLICGYGSFPKACVLNLGMDYETMILHIARLGLARSVEDEVDSIVIRNPIAAAVPV